VSFSALADYGAYRKQGLWLTTAVGVTAALFLLVTPRVYWLGAVAFVTSQVAHNLGAVFFTAYLPLMARADPRYISQPTNAVLERVASEISATGYAWGFAGATAMAVVGGAMQIGLVKAGVDEAMSYAWLCVLATVWWAVLGFAAISRLSERPGPPFPSHVTNVVTFSWRTVGNTFRKMKRIPRTGFFCLLWFFYSDGFGAILSCGLLITTTEIDWGCFDPSTALAYALVEVMVVGAVSSEGVSRLAARYGHCWHCCWHCRSGPTVSYFLLAASLFACSLLACSCLHWLLA
jgi:MFS-type transporter involved in bile tolerance (Atg22 family)